MKATKAQLQYLADLAALPINGKHKNLKTVAKAHDYNNVTALKNDRSGVSRIIEMMAEDAKLTAASLQRLNSNSSLDECLARIKKDVLEVYGYEMTDEELEQIRGA